MTTVQPPLFKESTMVATEGHCNGDGVVEQDRIEPGIYCRRCNGFLSHIFYLRLCLDMQTTLAAAPKGEANTLMREADDGKNAFGGKNMLCRYCNEKVGHCETGSVVLGGEAIKAYKPKTTYVITKQGYRIECPKNWSNVADALMSGGVLCVQARQLQEEAGRQICPREGLTKYRTIHVDMSQGDLPIEIVNALTKTPLRNYQGEMLNFALRHNSVVCLPTGSGKTLVAVAAIHAMLRLNKDRIAVFVVNTNPLVEQHARTIAYEVPGLRVKMLSGQIDASIRKKSKRALAKFELDVLVVTCQVLVNCLQETRIRIEDICILVLDEAHHVRGQSPMLAISDAVKGVEDRNFQPLVLGMTASPLQNPKKSNIWAELTTFCDTLNCHIAYPIQHDPYENGICKVDDYCAVPDPNESEIEVYNALSNYMKSVASRGQELIVGLRSHVQGEVSSTELEESLCQLLTHGGTKDSNRFRGYLRNLRKTLGEIGSRRDQARVPKVLLDTGNALVDHFMQILCTIEINNVVGSRVAKYAMYMVMNQIQNPTSPPEKMKKELMIPSGDRKYIEDICRVVSDAHDEGQYAFHCLSERCKLLINIILLHIKESDQDSSRILVFVNMRRTARKLHTCLRMNEDILQRLNPQVLLGNSIQGDGHIWQEQQELLKQFETGLTKLIIATTVIEEGLDVVNCNLVVRFNAPESYRQFVQSRGRASRSKKGKFKIICQSKEEFVLQFEFSDLQKNITQVYQQKMQEAIARGDSHACERCVLDLEKDFDRQDYIVKGECEIFEEEESEDDEDDDGEIEVPSSTSTTNDASSSGFNTMD